MTFWQWADKHPTITLLLIGAAIYGCGPKISEFKLSNGDVLIEYEGRQWRIAKDDVSTAKDNIADHDSPYHQWSAQETADFDGCTDAGGWWFQRQRECVWKIGRAPMRVKP